jgi:hypothetical protein
MSQFLIAIVNVSAVFTHIIVVLVSQLVPVDTLMVFEGRVNALPKDA